MRVLMLSWEYPPLVVGGLGRHVEGLARELARQGHDVRVVTRGDTPEALTETRDAVRVVRAAADPLAIDFTTESLLAWSQAAEHALLRAALPLLRRWQPDVVHGHDWLVAQSAVTLSGTAGAPLVATVHATEAGRHLGRLSEPLNLAIHSVEHWLASQADAVIACSTAMHDEVVRLFDLPPDRVRTIPNGIDPTRWKTSARTRAAARSRYTADAPLLVYAGRLVYEKGVQTLLAALPALRDAHPGLRLAVAGTGLHEPRLRAEARRLRIARTISWLGFVPEPELAALLSAADVVVAPSLYEPFGIVALEAAAVGAPLAVAHTGGLRDLVAAGVAVASFPPDDARGLAAAVGKLLGDAAGSRRAAARAAGIVRRNYTWTRVAERTVEIYRGAGLSRSAGP